MAFQLMLKPRTLILTNLRSIRLLSSSTPPLPPPPPSSAPEIAGDETNASSSSSDPTPPPSPPPFANYFSDVKDRLRSPPSPPRRIPDSPPPPPPSFGGTRPAPASLEDIRKHLAEFRLKSGRPPPASPSAPPTLSFQELFKNNALNRPDAGGQDGNAEAGKGGRLSFDSIRDSLRKFRGDRDGQPSQNAFKGFQFGNLKDRIGKEDRLPTSIFNKEGRKEADTDGEPKARKTDFLRMYSYEELGDKLRRLRPEEAAKGGKSWFSLTELNERLAKLREFEEKEADSRMGGVSFRDLRDSLVRLKEADANKKASMHRLSIISNLTGQATPAFMLKPPQEQLLEKYTHPDHMSSAEKMKLELKKVRDEFKMSESDCGSTRVQVALLTTKIKHLSSVLHKKDKHSRKGLQEMVQRRKKLLKYLRRTDWDSYCFALSKLGLRDVPEYKAPNYKA